MTHDDAAQEALRASLRALSPALRARLEARGFRDEELVARAREAAAGSKDERNRLTGSVLPPGPGDLVDAPSGDDVARLRALGALALARGEVALCVLAGGMATRMGGVVKALVEVFGEAGAPPSVGGLPAELMGKTFLELRLAEVDALARRHGAPVPLWLMTSEATNGPIRDALARAGRAADPHVQTFEQHVSLRLTREGRLFETDEGPSVYATGHGDLPDALQASGLLARFVERGGKWVWIANLDNLGATVDAAILGQHLESGERVSVELVDKVGSDRGGGPVLWNGQKLITEEFRLPLGFDPATVPVFNTNTFLVSAKALLDLRMQFTWVEVEKDVGGKKAVQFERLVGELTRELPPRLLRVPRAGAGSRFLPVKDVPELERRRPEIWAVLASRVFGE
jgi:UTP--glucose-1-phosphate uridylyltransferase